MRYFQIPRPDSERRPGRTCRHASCQKTTRESKPYCPDHLLFNRHAQIVAAEYEEILAERSAVNNNELAKVDLKGKTVEDILLFLSFGESKANDIAKFIGEKPPLAERYLAAMKKEGLVSLRKSGKGVIHAKLKQE